MVDKDPLDVESYSISDLLSIFKLNNPSVDDVENAVNIAVDKNRGNESVQNFIKGAGKKLINHLNTSNTAQSIEDVVTQYAAVDSNDNGMIVFTGATNPDIGSTSQKIIDIDSRRRRNLYPYVENNPNAFTSPSNFYINLESPLRNVLSYSLKNVTIPFSFFPFDYSDSNTFMWVALAQPYSTPRTQLNSIPKSDYKPLIIENGNYTGEQMAEQLNNAFGIAFPDASNAIQFSFLPVKHKISIKNNETDPIDQRHFRFVFFDAQYGFAAPSHIVEDIINPDNIDLSTDDGCVDETQSICGPETKRDNNLGYFLGFRPELRAIDGSTAAGLTDIHGTAYIDVLPGDSRVGSTQVDLRPPAYIVMVLDDGNHNYANVPLEMATDQVGAFRPSRAERIKKVALQDVTCDAGRRLFSSRTGEQPITILNAFNSNQEATYTDTTLQRTSNNHIRNAFAKLTFDYGATEFGQNLNITGGTDASKEFYAPITIQRFNIRLVNALGNTLNMHGQNWSFDLDIKLHISSYASGGSD